MARKETKLSRGGEEWTVKVMSQDEAREEDLDFWLQASPEERVRAVEELTLQELGLEELPPIQPVCRVVTAPWAKD